jgi:hypothetical protein
MKRSLTLGLLSAAILAITAPAATAASPMATTTGSPAPASSSSAPAVPAKPVVERPKADATIDRIITAMNNSSTWGHPDLFGEFAGMRLFYEGQFKAAMKYFEYGARYADKFSQLSIGLMYENGRGVARDPVTACAWIALAAERKYPTYIATRDRVCEALTPAQHDQAVAVLDKLLPEYGDAVAKPRMVRALERARTEMTGSRTGFDFGAESVGVMKGGCGGPTIEGTSQAGCGSTDFWSPWRWDPKKYFQMRDAHWRGVVTVGSLEKESQTHVKAAGAGKNPAQAAPAGASSSGH